MSAKVAKQRFGKGHYHFITCWCYERQPKLELEKDRDRFVRLLEEVRVKFRFQVAGYVVLPEHVQFLMSDPEIDTAERSVAMLKQRYGRRFNVSARSTDQVWETAFTDQHVWEPEAITARLREMHEAPVRRGLVASATEWAWSSARDYAGEPGGVVTVELAGIHAGAS